MKSKAPSIGGVRELIDLLGKLTGGHETLRLRIGEKIDAVKRADIEGLRVATQNEQRLVTEIERLNSLRAPLMDRIGQSVGLAKSAGRTMTLSLLAERLPNVTAEKLNNAAARLRGVMVEVAQANRAAGTICNAVLGHLAAVFSSAASSSDEAAGYSNRGGLVPTHEARIIEAVG